MSFADLGSTSSAFPIHKTLLHRIKTCPSVPELTPLMNSSVLESWMFMYRSTDTSLPLYSVSPHFNRTTMSLSTLYYVSMRFCTCSHLLERDVQALKEWSWVEGCDCLCMREWPSGCICDKVTGFSYCHSHCFLVAFPLGSLPVVGAGVCCSERCCSCRQLEKVHRRKVSQCSEVHAPLLPISSAPSASMTVQLKVGSAWGRGCCV